MPESRDLIDARRCLAEGEADFRSADGLASLDESLALLDVVIAEAKPAETKLARNLAATYAARIYAHVGELLARDSQVPEPVLEHLFKVVLAFDQVSAALPDSARELKISVVRQLIDRYYEGHPPEKKREALRELEQLRRRH